MKLTRRELGAALVTASAVTATAVSGQQPAPVVPSGTPNDTPNGTPNGPDDDLTLARNRMRASARALGAATIPMDTEPAFQFKA